MNTGHSSQQPANREIRIIEELIDHGKTKEALAKCDRQLKRDKNNASLMACKAVCLGRLARYEESWALCVQLSDRTPPITDAEAIRTIHDCYLEVTTRFRRDLDSHQVRSKLANLWIGAIKAGGGNKVAHAWIRHSLRNALFEDFQKATVVLARENPKSLEYHFWSIVGWFVAGEALRSRKPAESATFGKLAHAYIEKLVNATPHDSASAALSGRWISTSGQLRLVLQVLQRQRCNTELLNILDSSNLGISSRVAMKDWSFVRAKVEVMEAEAMWKELWEFCSTLLHNAHSSENGTSIGLEFGTQGDDWTVWKALLKSQAGMSDPANSLYDIQAIASQYIEQRLLSRNARLASLEGHCRGRGGHVGNGGALASPGAGNPPSEYLSACMKYFDDFGDKYHCFGDLQRYLREFSFDEWVLFRRHVSDVAQGLRPMECASEGEKVLWLNAEMNALKFDYMMEVSAPASPTEDVFHAFIATAIRLYNWSRQCGADLPMTDVQPGDDACLLAAAALLKLGECLRKPYYVLQAAVLLEGLLERSNSNADAKIMIVRIYTSLELGTLALHWYESLRLKKPQLISLAHLMYTRISTIHPHPMMLVKSRGLRKPVFDPYQELKEILAFDIETLDDNMPMLMFKALEDGAYDQVYEFFKVGGCLRHDFSRKMWILERRRIARLRGIPYDIDDLDYVDAGNDASIYSDASGAKSRTYVDNRDFVTGADFEYSVKNSATAGGFQKANSYPLSRTMPKPEVTAATASTFPQYMINANIKQSAWLSATLVFDMLCCLVLDQTDMPDAVLMPQRLRGSYDEFTSAERPLQVLFDMKIAVKFLRLSQGDSKVSVVDCFHDLLQWLNWFTRCLLKTEETTRNRDRGNAEWLWPITSVQTAFLVLDMMKILWQLCGVLTDEKKRALRFPHLRSVPTDSILVVRAGIERGFNVMMAMTRCQKTAVSSCAFATLKNQLLGQHEAQACSAIGEAMEELLGAEFVEHHVQIAVESMLEALDGVLQVKLY